MSALPKKRVRGQIGLTEQEENIRRKALVLRGKLGMTQVQFAAHLGATRSIFHYESGQLPWPLFFEKYIDRDLKKLS